MRSGWALKGCGQRGKKEKNMRKPVDLQLRSGWVLKGSGQRGKKEKNMRKPVDLQLLKQS